MQDLKVKMEGENLKVGSGETELIFESKGHGGPFVMLRQREAELS